jgi:hypothetical protein
MRVLDKSVQINEDFKPVLLITLELPLTLSGGFHIKGKEFMDQLSHEFYEAVKLYDDEQPAKATGGE